MHSSTYICSIYPAVLPSEDVGSARRLQSSPTARRQQRGIAARLPGQLPCCKPSCARRRCSDQDEAPWPKISDALQCDAFLKCIVDLEKAHQPGVLVARTQRTVGVLRTCTTTSSPGETPPDPHHRVFKISGARAHFFFSFPLHDPSIQINVRPSSATPRKRANANRMPADDENRVHNMMRKPPFRTLGLSLRGFSGLGARQGLVFHEMGVRHTDLVTASDAMENSSDLI